MGRTNHTRHTNRRRTRSKASTSSKYGGRERTDKSKSVIGGISHKPTSKRPKKALGPYMYYCKLNRKSVQLQNPNLGFGDIGRLLGSQWCALDDKEKKKYVKKAQVDKLRYAKQMRRYAK